MTDIWRKTDGTWSIMPPSGFTNETELHDQIVEAPDLLPLAGQPLLAATFREVPLGGGSLDVLAFEDTGRPVVIEVKLKKNAEARRAVIAQTLTYAAGLHGVKVEELERSILAPHLSEDGHERLADAVEETTGGSGFDRDGFYKELTEHLDKGSFRLVIVLDDAPTQLVRLMGYLETITTDQIAVDLVAVSAYDINGDQILIPQLIDTERAPPNRVRRARSTGIDSTRGTERFRELSDQWEDEQLAARGQELAEWAERLETDGLCRLYTRESAGGGLELRPQLLTGGKTFAHLWPESTGFGAWLWMSVIERRAPNMLSTIRELSGVPGDRGFARTKPPELLDALESAYREALTTRPNRGRDSHGSDLFREWVATEVENAEQVEVLLKVANWADDLAGEEAAQVRSRIRGSGQGALSLRTQGQGVSFVVLDTDGERNPRLWLEGLVIRNHAPNSSALVEQTAGRSLDKSGHARAITPELLDALADAYREAAGR